MGLTGLIGKKNTQTQGFLQDGTRVPLTVISAMGNSITQLKTTEKDGYNSIQLGFGIKKKPNKVRMGHSKKAGLEKAARFFREVRLDDLEGLTLGSQVLISDVLKPGDIVDVTGVSKGKGFAGVVKRHHFKGGPRTHGQSDRERAPGSIGQTTTPGHVYKGKRMAGRMGSESVTIKNLEVIDITNDGVVLIKGLVPGSVNSVVLVRKVGENKKFVPLYREEVPLELKAEEPAQTEEKVEEVRAEEVPVMEVKEAVEEVKTAQENVQTAAENVQTTENVQTASEEVKTAEEPIEEKKKAVSAESSDEPKEVKDAH